jgi:hypothetical protein
MMMQISFELYNWLSHTIALIGILAISLPTFWMVKLLKKFDAHQPIAAASVKSVSLYARGHEREAEPDEMQNIIAWFNKAAFIQKQDVDGMPECESGIWIELQTGEQILIRKRDRDGDIDILRKKTNHKLISYWARQAEIQGLLEKLTA